MKNYLVFGITCLISASSFSFVVEAATIGRNGRPRLTLSMTAQSRSAIQSMREFALYMGPKGLQPTPEESSRQRMLDFELIPPAQRQMLADDESLPYELRSQLPEFQAKQNAGNPRGIKCRRRADLQQERDVEGNKKDAAGSGSSDTEFAECNVSDEDSNDTSGADDPLIAIQFVFSMISFAPLVPLVLL
ncbi:uncharacterized protein LOC113567432 [Drosophila persimilis]|uniref:uncharacterized protein LOC113567432 n=1 Tax=Drosophila persimilis TaxID=7234 RepID=UPI000F077064|nr:uncharacterized protein LOC113567432 [Drosophila persimilis]